VAPEEPALVEMQEEDRQNAEDDQDRGEEKDDRQEVGLVGGQLFQLHAGFRCGPGPEGDM
jgi:hypothetical protein